VTAINLVQHVPINAVVISNSSGPALGAKKHGCGLSWVGSSAPRSCSLTPAQWDGGGELEG